MLKLFKNNYVYLLIIVVIITFMGVQLFFEQNENLNPVIFTLIGILIVPFIAVKIERALDLIILFAPLSIPFLLPFVNTKISVPSELLSAIIVLVFLIKAFMGLSFRKDILKHPITILLILDLLWTLITALTGTDIGVSIKRFVLKLTFVFVYYYLFSNFYNNTTKQYKIFTLYGIGLIIPIIYAFMDSIKLGFGQASSFVIGQPFFSDHTIYGACLAFVIPFYLLHLKKKFRVNLSLSYLFIPLLILIFAAEFQSYSRASWISLIACLIFYLITKFKIKGYQLAAGMFLIGIVFLLNFQNIYKGLRESEAKYDDNVGAHLTSVTNLQSDASNLERINRWVCAYRMFQERPLLGFGPGTYQFEYDKFQTPEFMTRISTHKGNRGNAHSEYLTYLSETGIPGLIFYLLLIIYTIHLSLKLIYANLEKKQKRLVYAASLGLITFFIHGLFNTFSDYEKMSILIYGSLSILVTIDLYRRKQNNLEK
jgi:putative inorganic carbon (HCO3(-)) transporter